MSGPLYKFYTNKWKDFLQTWLKCTPQMGNVKNPSYPCTSFVNDIGGDMNRIQR